MPGLLDLLEEGDAVMADRGFTISDLLEPLNATLYLPSRVFPGLSCPYYKISHMYTTHHHGSLNLVIVRMIIFRWMAFGFQQAKEVLVGTCIFNLYVPCTEWTPYLD